MKNEMYEEVAQDSDRTGNSKNKKNKNKVIPMETEQELPT